MEAGQLLALTVVGVALVAFVPTFNALNEQKVVDLRPPWDMEPPKDLEPPPDFVPPPGSKPPPEVEQPPPVPPCEPRAERVVETILVAGAQASSPRFPFEVGADAYGLVVMANYTGYRGSSSVDVTNPEGRDANVARTGPDSVLSPRSEAFERGVEAPAQGEWVVSALNQGVAGRIELTVVVGYLCPAPAEGA